MKFRFLQLEMNWSKDLPLHELRPWLLGKMRVYGEPLRWAVTDLDGISNTRKLRLEAVVIVSES